jgi:hypothetical protein
MDGWIVGWMDGWIDWWVGGWIAGWVYWWMDIFFIELLRNRYHYYYGCTALRWALAALSGS